MVVRRHHLLEPAGGHALPADHARDLDLLARLARQLRLERRALGRAGRVGEDRLVRGGGMRTTASSRPRLTTLPEEQLATPAAHARGS